MPRKNKVVEPEPSESSESEYSSISEESQSEEEATPPPKKSRSGKATTPSAASAPVKRPKKEKGKEKAKPAEPESSEEDEDADDDVDKLKAGAQKVFDEHYAKAFKRSSGKKASGLPQGTGLYLKTRSDIGGKTQWILTVAGKGNYASDKALEAARKYLDDSGFRSSLRVSIVQQ